MSAPETTDLCPSNCARCKGTGVVETCDMVMALAYALKVTRRKPKPTGSMRCPWCFGPGQEAEGK